MKHLIILSTTLFLIACSSTVFAQSNNNGLYFSGNIGLNTNSLNRNLFRPSIGIGYLHGEKFRHNISLNANQFGFGRSMFNSSFDLRYSYDIRMLQKKNFSLYTSPFITNSFTFNRYNSITQENNFRTINTIAGIALQAEQKISKKATLTFGIPVNLFSLYHQSQKTTVGNVSNRYSSSFTVPANVGLQLGLRVNLWK